ncbi:Immunoglobulin subtype domain and Fibronectin,type III domain and Immunoglobulin-like domain and Immunoglobulin I-set domain and Immunoglobulin-like fold domain-containing protein [Strongyloides ratti]|uniref:Immunoglobulin subtype domain and Fibronectin,type III domain and Immunoglobulin-like domain and Immunoglobulin I-set domain and Immunoglobulin-like fold domain-containing protein n=1 Tax=Strongyloides ratti TaxID=34506 RepID=A0A090KSP9_STRRB|nr:Immunoglobulin subtype domain and Fibronectin,type III domain and Immunoglobulin-like domain and Immunoglobulin I-set domain and Immunoglobulin-like fold domain-containing protein [Strongyloides ratti]CEF60530.1 Immunoglobulin subtype domain and Fibronectin,type III domain and Immunoglobulin-like domain and Immunoglobulin I-set domain and Immunoglobulin-like fold domain-containing protein [Strongyloides ratti]
MIVINNKLIYGILSLILLILTIQINCNISDNEDGSSKYPLRIEPKGNNYKFVTKAGRNFQVSCVFEKEGIAKVEDIQWLTGDNQKIDAYSSNRIFTIELNDKHTHNPKKLLLFDQLEPRMSGNYTCKGKHFDREYSQTIQLIVTDNLIWNNNDDIVGGMEGDPLIIDCGAIGTPDPDIQFTDENGDLLNENEFKIAGNEITIEKLTSDFQGKKIKCIAVQYFEEHETTSIEEKTFKIDVWTVPQFESHYAESYGIVGRNGRVDCKVVKSNPPVKEFRFFKSNVEIGVNEKFMITVDTPKQEATLHIFNVDEDDFNQYRCDVTNGKASNHQTIILKVSNPPSEVRATLKNVHKHAIKWHLTTTPTEPSDSDTANLPVTQYIIEYVRKDKIMNENDDENDIEINVSTGWSLFGQRQLFNVTHDGMYKIHGLRQNTSYLFRFTAVNAAGTGNPFIVTAKTSSDHHHKYESSSSITKITIINEILVFLGFSIFYLLTVHF